MVWSWFRRSRPVSSVAAGQTLAHETADGRIHLMRVATLLDMGCRCGCVQPVIRFLEWAEPRLPTPDELAAIPDRRHHPRWKKTELRIVDDDPGHRELARITVVEGSRATTPDNPKAAATWAEVAAYLGTRS